MNKKPNDKESKFPIITFKWLVLFVVSCFLSCSPKFGHRILNIFFDGVENQHTVKARLDTIKIDTIRSTISVVATSSEPTIFYHKPYQENNCNICHDPNKMTINIASTDSNCYSCHTNYRTKLKFVHKPLLEGTCLNCHVPHFAKDIHLLKDSGNDLCVTCHTSTKLMEFPIHKRNTQNKCVQCHNPHGGSDRLYYQNK